ncbi:C40 family peptidase [Corynebacterium sp. UMB4614]|uniref:C40 family peptidase n=1 Tax=Corynebacterium sp. UMB4614 TaxID=3046334 RepID=UPI00254A09FB|nr:C40 family peptidase [Corynebacterium sp. UMB4614]MDK7134433.1 NlpC/P60 family protein [Corynebacterium sp. UMB4614]
MSAPVLAPAGGHVIEEVAGSVLGEMAGSVLGGGGCVPDFLGLVKPIAALIPQPLQPGVSALLGSGVSGLAGEVIQTVGSAVLGEAGGAMAAKFAQGSDAVDLIEEVRQGLDAVAGRGQQAILAAIEDVGAIAMEALAEIGGAVNPVQLLGPTAPVALAEAQAIALKHLSRAEARVQALGQELLGLAEEATATVVPAEAIPEAPAPSEGASGQPPAAAHSGSATGPEAGHGGAAADSSDAVESSDAVAGAPTEAAAKAVAAAKTQLGTPYVWGGTTPGQGFDCSGFVQWAYGQAGVELPRLADQQAVGPQIPMDQVQPGDLAVWDGHVAMVIEDGQLIEAGDPVGISPIRTENIGMGFHGFYRPTG